MVDRPRPDTSDGFDDDAPVDGPDEPGHGLDAFDFLYRPEQGPVQSGAESFTVTNPPRTVSVTAHLDGRIQQVRLSADAAALSETELCEDVLVLADLANQQARSAQHAMALETMTQSGHDAVSTRDFLTRNLDLPSPEDAAAARAQVFATRYPGE